MNFKKNLNKVIFKILNMIFFKKNFFYKMNR